MYALPLSGFTLGGLSGGGGGEDTRDGKGGVEEEMGKGERGGE